MTDVDDSDGVVDKPLHDTMVHEFGHLLGLGDQRNVEFGCSAMYILGAPTTCARIAGSRSFASPQVVDYEPVSIVY